MAGLVRWQETQDGLGVSGGGGGGISWPRSRFKAGWWRWSCIAPPELTAEAVLLSTQNPSLVEGEAVACVHDR